MKKKICKLLSVIMSLVIVLGFSTYSQAAEAKTLMEKRQYLKTLGVTDDYLDQISEEKISSLYDRFSIKTRSNEGIQYQWSGYDVQIKEFEESPMTRGDISPSKLKLVIGYMNEVSGTSIKGVVVSVYYKWLSGPQVRIKDGMAVAWESSVFNSDGFYAASYGTINGRHVECDFVDYTSEKTSGGVGWTFSLTSPGHPGEIVNDLNGGADIHLYPVRPITTTSGTSCQLYVTYGHRTIAVGAGISFTAATKGFLTIKATTTVATLLSEYRWRSNVSSGSSN